MTRALVAKELARIVYYVLQRQEPYNGTFKGQPLSRTKQPKWPRLTNPAVETGAARSGSRACSSLVTDWGVRRRCRCNALGSRGASREPVMVYGRHQGALLESSIGTRRLRYQVRFTD